MLLASTMLALTMLGAGGTRTPTRPGPGPACAAPTHTGTFRVTAMRPDSSEARLALVVLENIDGCLEVTLLTDEGSPAIIDHLATAADSVSGQVRTLTGKARITLRFDGTGVKGSILDGKTEWSLSGRRTS